MPILTILAKANYLKFETSLIILIKMHIEYVCNIIDPVSEDRLELASNSAAVTIYYDTKTYIEKNIHVLWRVS